MSRSSTALSVSDSAAARARSSSRSSAAAAVLGALALGAAAMSATAATSVSVTAGKPSELRFKLSSSHVSKGKVTFKVKNGGTLSHDFKIAGKRTKLLKKGKSTTLTVTL